MKRVSKRAKSKTAVRAGKKANTQARASGVDKSTAPPAQAAENKA
jgi:hypothetical protein